MLTENQRKLREGKLTASRVACLMTGDKVKILQLWRELCGDPAAKEEDLSDIWAVQLGIATERLNLDWYQRIQGREVVRRGDVVSHSDYDWACCTLDGYDSSLSIPVEVKHVSGFEKYEVVLQRYMPQLHWQMICTGARQCAFSVIQGGRQPTVEIVDYDETYGAELISRAKNFMQHVWNMTEPVVLDPVNYVQKSALKDYNMTGNNLWAAAAHDWLTHKPAADKHKEAETKLREYLPHDARTCTGYGLVARRDKALRVSIRADDAKR